MDDSVCNCVWKSDRTKSVIEKVSVSGKVRYEHAMRKSANLREEMKDCEEKCISTLSVMKKRPCKP